MTIIRTTAFCCLLLGGAGAAWAAAGPGRPAAVTLPPPAAGEVQFARDVKPLFEGACIQCHAHGQKKGGFQLDSRDQLLKGGDSGPAARAGQSAESLLVKLAAGFEPERVMPQKGPRLTAPQIGLLRRWIDQGLPWGEGVKLGRGVKAPLAARRVALPPAKRGFENPVDRLLSPYYAAHQGKAPQAVEGRLFARRAYLDVIGLLPTPAELRAFEADRRADKRGRLVRELLGRNQAYAEHWMTFWNDALRNDYRGTGYIDGGRKQVTPWLYTALATNLPFDRFVAQLVNPDEHSEGFVKGIVWRGVVNASQRPELQAAQGIGQVFLGLNLKCASCHDSFISDWKLADTYALAGVYADEPLELVRCDKPLGQKAERRFLFPELGAVPNTTNRAERLAGLARAITNPGNGRLARTIVNRLWARFLGRGLVEPVDEMDNPPWDADLLDWLALDLAEHGYDLKHTMELILTSRAYQLPAVGLDERNQDRFVFRGPVVKRLTGEQFLDALAALTGVWHALPANTDIDFAAANPATREPLPRAAWVWTQADAAKAAPTGTVYLRKTFALPRLPQSALAVVTADNRFTLYVNGKDVGSGDKWEKPHVLDIRSQLRVGENVLAVSAVNDSPSEKDHSPNPAGFFFLARLREDSRPAAGAAAAQPAAEWDFGSDASWVCATNKTEGWQKPDFKAEGWRPAVELGDAGREPWGLAAKLAACWSSAGQYGHVRAVLANNDALMTALGRSNREQVVTSRPTAATTLQALEFTNGATLAEFLKRGVKHLLAAAAADRRQLVTQLYRHALGRAPTAAELKLAGELTGEPVQAEGVEDLLWAMTMQPEFQLIY